MFTYALSALALAGAAAAQATNNGTLASALDIAAIEAHFERESSYTPRRASLPKVAMCTTV